MSEKMVTEKDAVLREREAFKRGHVHGRACHPFHVDLEKSAELRYPLPTVRVHRTAFIHGALVRWEPGLGVFQGQTLTGQWEAITLELPHLLGAEIRALADLKENPYKEVEA